jgi:hypothetical protein
MKTIMVKFKKDIAITEAAEFIASVIGSDHVEKVSSFDPEGVFALDYKGDDVQEAIKKLKGRRKTIEYAHLPAARKPM